MSLRDRWKIQRTGRKLREQFAQQKRNEAIGRIVDAPHIHHNTGYERLDPDRSIPEPSTVASPAPILNPEPTPEAPTNSDLQAVEVRRLKERISQLEEENANLIREIALNANDLKGEVRRLQVQAGDLLLFKHRLSNERLQDMNAFGIGMSALVNLRREIGHLVGGDVMLIASRGDIEVTRLNASDRQRLRDQLDEADERDLSRSQLKG